MMPNSENEPEENEQQDVDVDFESELEEDLFMSEVNSGKDVEKISEGTFVAEDEDGSKEVIISGTMMDTSYNANHWRVTEDVLNKNGRELDSSVSVRVQHSKNDWDMVGKLDFANKNGDRLDYVARIKDSDAIAKFEDEVWSAETMGVSPGMDRSTVTAECNLCGEVIFDDGEFVESAEHKHMKGFEYDGEAAKMELTDGLVGELSLTSKPAYGGDKAGSIDRFAMEADEFNKEYLKAQKESIQTHKNNITGENQMTEEPNAEGGEEPSEPEEDPENQGETPESEEQGNPEDQGAETSEGQEEDPVAERLDELEDKFESKLEAREETIDQLQEQLEAQKDAERKKKLTQFRGVDEEMADDILADVESDEQFESELQRIKKLTAERKGSSPKSQQAEEDEIDQAFEAETGRTTNEMIDDIVSESDYGKPKEQNDDGVEV